MNKLIIKETRNGRGVFCSGKFIEGETIMRVVGKKITCDEDDEVDDRLRSNTFRFDDEYFLSPEGELADFLNHSCEPNSKVVKEQDKLFLVAIRDIHGEEIVFDYSTIIASDDVWEMDCNCGSDSCRGVIGQFKKLPKNLKQHYIQNKIVPEYILNI